MIRPLAIASLALCGCFPEFEDTPWLIERPRVLAVRGVPAEAPPLAEVQLEALVAAPEGPLDDGSIAWSICLRPRTLAERNGVAPECLSEGEEVRPLPSSIAQIPVDACARFGPNPPPSPPDEPPLRPADPDPTGGYYLPVRASLPSASIVAFGFERLRCSLAGAPREVFRAYQERYADNRNPRIEAVEIGEVAPGAPVVMRVRTSTDSIERYVQYDPISVSLIDRVESMTVSWFANAGRFEAERSGIGEEEAAAGALTMDNLWTAPVEPRTVQVWVVLRDARGGVDWKQIDLDVP